MSAKKQLTDFLRARKTSSKDAAGQCTHTSIPEEDEHGKHVGGGSYVIGPGDHEALWRIYYEAVFKQNAEMRLNEIHRKCSKAHIDIDLKYADLSITKHVHTMEQTRAFLQRWMQALAEVVNVPDRCSIYVLQKAKPVLKGARMSDGTKAIIPALGVHNLVLEHVRSVLLPEMPDFFGELPLENKPETWEEVYDKGNVNWQMYGSKKPNNLTYHVVHEFVFDRAADAIVEERAINYIDFESSYENVRRMSAYVDEAQIATFTDMGYATLGRKFHKSCAPEGMRRSAHAGVRPRVWELDNEEIFAHVDNIANVDCTYDAWYRLGQTLFNLGTHDPDGFYNAWVQWSAKSQKHDEHMCERTWRGMNYRQDGLRLGMRSILNMSRESNPVRFREITDASIFRLIRTAVGSTTDYDIARIMYRMYSERFRCAGGNTRGSLWYEFKGHTWEETDEICVRKLMSTEVYGIIKSKSDWFYNQLEDAGDTWEDDASTSTRAKSVKHKTAEQKQAESQCKNLNKVLAKLKTSGAKSSILRECCELFYEAGFMSKLDTNPDLLGCANGVFDMKQMKFRDGMPDDYVSRNTRVAYDTEKPWHEVPHAAEVQKFFADVLPDETVRSFFLKGLANSLCGSYEDQRIHICTGRGKNGKSMVMELIKAMLGSYYVALPITLLTRKRSGVGAANPELMALKGARYAMAQEPDNGDELNMGQIKELTGETISARALYGMLETFKLQAKVYLCCNDKPKVSDSTDGAWRRLMVFFFPRKFVSPDEELGPDRLPCDPSLARRIPNWGEAMLAMLIQMLMANGGLFDVSTPPAKILEYSEEYRQQNDCVAKFMADCLEDNRDETGPAVTQTALRATFKSWQELNRPQYNSVVFDAVERRVVETYGKKPTKGWKTFSIKEEDDE